MVLTAYWLFLVFVVGLVVGSFLNVVIARLPLEKSILWPGSRCGACQQRIRWYDNLPVISFLLLRGRCRSCGARFSARYLLIELLTGFAFAGLFYLEVVVNIHGWPDPAPWARGYGYFPWQAWVGFIFHAILMALLLAASATDLMGREIPLPLTMTGTVIGLIGVTLLPWPWPWSPPQIAHPVAVPPLVPMGMEWMLPAGGLKTGMQPWPVWGPLPAFLDPGGNWQTGLVTGVVGALVGTFMMRAIGFVFSSGLGRESMGLGDADLMMMVGAFLGWQHVVVALFVSVVPAVVFGIVQLFVNKDNSLPFGPSLAAGSMATCLGWAWLPESVWAIFFAGWLLAPLAAFAVVFLFVAALTIRLSKRPVRQV